MGILTGRERAATLAHVDTCLRCAEELEQLSHAADAVVRVAPELEPSMGFEVRLFNRMGLAAEVPPALDQLTPIRRIAAVRWARRSPRWVMAVAAAVSALAIGLFTAKDGYGAWGAPIRVAPQDVKKAEVVSSKGTVIATASSS
jgi:hypothetical protein